MRSFILAATSGLALLATDAPGQAATYYFNFTGDHEISFTLDSNPSTAIYGSDFTSSTANGGYFRIRGIAGLFDGVATTSADLVFYPSAALGGMRVAVGSAVFSVLGPQLFTDAVTSPSFSLGTYDFTEQKLPGNTHPQPVDATLTISDAPLTAPVPEPANWAIMVAGFALAGATLRRTSYRTARLR
jgi:hypothetical protein